MFSSSSLLGAVVLALRLASEVHADLVRRDLHIQNANLAPDGFNRSYASDIHRARLQSLTRSPLQYRDI